MTKNWQNRPKSPIYKFSKFRPGIGFLALKSATQCKIDRRIQESGQYGPIMGQNKFLQKNRFSGLLGLGGLIRITGALIWKCDRLATLLETSVTNLTPFRGLWCALSTWSGARQSFWWLAVVCARRPLQETVIDRGPGRILYPGRISYPRPTPGPGWNSRKILPNLNFAIELDLHS